MSVLGLLVPLLSSAASAGSVGLTNGASLSAPIAPTTQLSTDIPRCGSGYGRSLPLLPEHPSYTRSEDGVSHGSALLIEAIGTVAATMRATYPDADPMIVGRLNQPGGARNKFLMHQDGLDGDLGIYTRSGEQAGFGREATPETLDVKHTWAAIRAFFATNKVMWILLDQSLIDTLHTWVVRSGELSAAEAKRVFPPAGYQGFLVGGTVMHASGHTNHMHVHMKCSES